MLWFSLAFLTAVFSATEAAFLKRWFGDLRPMEMGSVAMCYAQPLFIVALLFTPIPELKPGFWWNVLYLYPFHTGGFLFYFWAISTAPLSIVMPFLAATPAFVLLSGFMILGEVPNAWGFVGVAAITAGGYILNYNPKAKLGPLGPFKVMFKDKGAMRALAAAALFGMASVMGKKCILLSEPLFFAFFFFIFFCVTCVLGLAAFRLINLRNVLSDHKRGAVVGTILFAHIICHMVSISMTKAAYMMSIKRFSAVIGVVYGGLLFKEENIFYRLMGATMMFLGVAVIGLLGD